MWVIYDPKDEDRPIFANGKWITFNPDKDGSLTRHAANFHIIGHRTSDEAWRALIAEYEDGIKDFYKGCVSCEIHKLPDKLRIALIKERIK